MELTEFVLTGKVAVVTGGSQGVGKGIALGLARAGASMVIAARTVKDIEAVATEIRALNGRALPVPVDVRRSDQVSEMVQKAINEFGGIDILVNNVGGSSGDNFHRSQTLDMSEKDWDETITLNLKTVFLCSKAVAQVMIEQKKKGSIINITSVAGQTASPGSPAYGAAKAGVTQLTQTLAVEWAPHNIRVNAIALGAVDVPRLRPGRTPERLTRLLSGIPLGRIGQPEDVAGTAIYLASDASNYVTGAVVMVSGGQSSTFDHR